MEILEPGFYYHIYNQANGNENLFTCDDNYHYFLKRYNDYISPIADTYAYCLMPNHFHFLLKIKEDVEIAKLFPKFQKAAQKDLQGFQNLGGLVSKQFSNFFNSYSKAFNKMYDRKGSLFIKNYKRKRITTEQYLKKAIAYIHLNPVHHEFVLDLNDWEFSSFKTICSSKSSFVKRNEVISLFEDLQNFKDYHKIKNAEIYAAKMILDY